MAYIEMVHSFKRYHMGDITITANNDVSFGIERGELAIILGSSGAGKSTVLNILGGMDTNSEGKVIIDGVDISDFNAKQLTDYRRNNMLFYSSRLSFSCGGVGKPPFSRAGRAGGLTCGATMARLGPRYGSGRFSLRATSSRVEGDGLAGTGAAPMVSFPGCAPRSFFRFGSQQSQPPYRKRIAANAGRPSAKVPPDPLR